ncbi:MAG: hypothetical protein H6Q65_966 [Firmicutes bacterium]|nr:hypothetical protein [Bacillota bacterium]
MQTYYPTITTLKASEVRRYAGLSPQTDFSEQMLQTAMREAILLIHPQGTWNTYPYDEASHIIYTPDPVTLEGKNIQKFLTGAVQVAILAVTISTTLEEEVTRLFADNSYTAALLLDAAGTAAVEQTADELCRIIRHQSSAAGLVSGNRFSPGYGDWNILSQKEILPLSGGPALGITLTAASMLVPRKSVTAIVGLYPTQAQSYPLDTNHLSCQHCNQNSCLARKETTNHDKDF